MKWRIYKLIIIILISFLFLSSKEIKKWGFQGHKIINKMAVFTLPSEIAIFFKKNIEFITENSTTPDSRRYSNKKEGAGHYIDMEYYTNIDSLKELTWKQISKKIPEDSLLKHGTLPWRVIQYKYLLQKAFENKSYKDILKYASELGHYIADAHVPLHTTKNYNGQYTNQNGIHSLWETKIVNTIINDLIYLTKKAEYINDLNTFIWGIIIRSNNDVNKVLSVESKLSNETNIEKYTFPFKNEKKTYSEEYIKIYNEKLNGMVENKIKLAIENLGSVWYTAWVDAGQPNLIKKEVIKSAKIKNNVIHECN